MKDFWLSCGHHLLDRDDAGALLVAEEFLKAYLARPELAPPGDACIAERTLHAGLLANPRRPVAPSEIAAIADGDARENWALMTAFRDRLLTHGTVEAAYLDLIRRGAGETPPHAGSLIAADEEQIAGVNAEPVSPLVAMLGLPPAGDIDVLNEDNAQSYWERSDRFDMAFDLTAGRRGLNALGEVIERWIAHLLSVAGEVEPLIEATDVDLAWYIGLDADATAIGDALWNGQELDHAARERIVGLYRLVLRDHQRVLEKAKGEPIYLIMAMTPERTLRMKPQNLITGLPVAHFEAVP